MIYLFNIYLSSSELNGNKYVFTPTFCQIHSSGVLPILFATLGKASAPLFHIFESQVVRIRKLAVTEQG